MLAADFETPCSPLLQTPLGPVRHVDHGELHSAAKYGLPAAVDQSEHGTEWLKWLLQEPDSMLGRMFSGELVNHTDSKVLCGDVEATISLRLNCWSELP